MLQNYTYCAYGLTVMSTFPIPELAIGEGKPDVIIRLDFLPAILENSTAKGIRFEAAPGRFLANMDGIGRYYVSNGREIVIEPCKGASDLDIRIILLDLAFGALLHQRGYFMLRASAIAVNNQAIIFSGSSGVGKSTLAAAFYKKGYPILADDRCLIQYGTDGRLHVVPAYPQLKLWEDSLEKLGEDINTLPRIRQQLERYAFSVKDRYCQAPLPLSKIYALIPNATIDTTIRLLHGSAKIEALIPLVYHFRFLDGITGRSYLLEQCTAVANEASIYTCSWSTHIFNPMSLATILEKEMVNS